MPTLYPDHIDPLLCTHIHYAFADINPLTLTITPTEEHDIHWTERLGMVLTIIIFHQNIFYFNIVFLIIFLATLPSYVWFKTEKSQFKNNFIRWWMVSKE